MLGDGAYILNFNKITGDREKREERRRERERSGQQHVALPSEEKVESLYFRSATLECIHAGREITRRICPGKGWMDCGWRDAERRREYRAPENSKSFPLLFFHLR